MISRHHLKLICPKTPPQRLLVRKLVDQAHALPERAGSCAADVATRAL